MIGVTAFHWVLRQLARSRSVTKTAVIVRNQLDHIVRYHFGWTFYTSDPAAELLLCTFAKQAHRVVDVGANVGRWTESALSILNGPAEAILIEPSSSALQALSKKFDRDPRVRIIPAAAGDQQGTVTFHEEADSGETSTVVADARRRPTLERKVRLTTVAAELNAAGWESADIVKIDAEGYDLHVLRGMTNLIEAQSIAVLIFEYNVSWRPAGSLLAEAESLLKRSGYEMYVLRKDGLYKSRYARYGEYFAYSNFVAVSPRAHGALAPLVRGSY